MIRERKHIDRLIIRILSGEVSGKEKVFLEQWLKISEANRKYFEQIKFIHEKAIKTFPEIDFNIDKAWLNVKSQMKTIPVVEIKSYRNQWSWFSVAASVIILIGLSAIIYLSVKQKSLTNIQTIAIESMDSTLDQKLPDSSQIFLNRGTRITYNSDYGKRRREVSLSGEAYINVVHMVNNPLIVKVEEVFIKDIGTAFNVRAYPDEDEVEVYVETGSVNFYSDDNPGISLDEGQTGIYNKRTRYFAKQQTSEPNIISYKTRSFTFINAKLSDVIRQLNNVYSIQLYLKKPELGNCTITVSFENENIETIASIISETLDLKVHKTQEGYILDGLVCNNP